MTLFEFVEERDKAIESNDINMLTDFIKRACEAGMLSAGVYWQFSNSDEIVKIATSHKMAMNATAVSKERKQIAKEWLTAHGMDYRL